MPTKKATKAAPAPVVPKAGAPAWTTRVAHKVASALALSKSKAKIFRPCLDEEKIAAFEKKLGVPVPQEYREYLLYLGGGGYGPYSGIVPLKKAENAVPAILVSVLDHNEPVMLLADGPAKGTMVLFEENTEEWVSLGTFVEYFEEWVENDLLRDALGHAIQDALEKKKPLKPELHELVLQYQSIFDRPLAPGSHWLARTPGATLALYLGDRVKAERICAELVAIEQEEEKVELGAGTYVLLRALWPDDVESATSKDAAALERASKHPSAGVRQLAVWRDEMPSAGLSNMAEDPSDEVRMEVARHAKSTTDTLKRVFEFTHRRWKELGPSTRRLLALELACRHPQAPVAQAEEICKTHAASKEPLAPWLVRGALLHPKVAETTLSALSDHPHPAVRQGVACHPALPKRTLEALAKDRDEAVRAAIAFRSDTPPEILASLTRDDFSSVVIVAIWNESTPLDAIVRLVTEGRSDLLVALSYREGLPKKAAAHVAKHPWYRAPDRNFVFPPFITDDGRQCISTRSFRINVGDGHRRYLAGVSSYEVWDAGAYAHPAYPVPILPAYIDEHYGNGGREMAFHPWLDDALMTTLATPKEPIELHGSTLSAIAEHPRLLPSLRDQLLEGHAQYVANNPILPSSILERLATNADEDVRAAVAEHRKTPTAVLVALAKDGAFAVRRSIAANASTPPSVVDALVNDENERVRNVAEWTVKARALAS